MSRYHKDRDDKGVAKKGAGAFSRSYLKLNRPPEYAPYASAGQSDHHKSRDIFDEVKAVSVRNYGLSASVSANRTDKRLSHKADKRSLTGVGIDSPDVKQWRKGHDYE
jgi:hypothetical protein